MTEQEYLEQRLDSQLKYFSKKSRRNRFYYYGLKATVLVLSLLIPLLSGLLNVETGLKIWIGCLGVALAVLNGLETLFKFYEKWINYRTTAEGLKREKYLFLIAAGPYENNPTLKLLGERVEDIIARQNTAWEQLIKIDDKHKSKG